MSLSRISNFNKHNYNTFFDNISEVIFIYRYISLSFEPQEIWNLDATGVMKVQRPNKILAQKKKKKK